MFKIVAASLLCGAGAAGVVICILLLPPMVEAPVLAWNGSNVRVQVGTARAAEHGLKLQLDDSGQAIIALPLAPIEASQYPFLHLVFSEALPGKSLVILWNTPQSHEQSHHYRVPGAVGQTFWFPLRNIDQWSGHVGAFTIVILGRPGETIVLHKAELLPPSLSREFHALYREWATFVPWRHSSINMYSGTRSAGSGLYPVPVIAMFLAFSLLAYCLLLPWCARGKFDWRVVGTIFVIGWITLDLNWQGTLIRQLMVTYQQYAGKDSAQKLAAGVDRNLASFMEEVRGQLPSPDTPIFVGSADDYSGMRGAYYLYPLNVLWQRKGPEIPPLKYLTSGGYIVLVNPTRIQFDPDKNALLTPDNAVIPAQLILSGVAGNLYRLI